MRIVLVALLTCCLTIPSLCQNFSDLIDKSSAHSPFLPLQSVNKSSPSVKALNVQHLQPNQLAHFLKHSITNSPTRSQAHNFGYNSNNLCPDTSFRRLLGFYNATIYPRSLIKTGDGAILLTLEMYDTTQAHPWKGFGLLVKLDAKGNIIWLKQFAETNPGAESIFSLINAFELSNHDIICTGYFSTNGNSSVYSTVVYRLNSSGNIIWKNNLKTTIGIFNSVPGTFSYTVTGAVDGLNGDVILCGTSNSNISSGHIETVVRLNNLGQRVWDANFGNHGINGAYLFGAEGITAFMKNGQIVLVGLSHGTNNPQKAPAINFLTLDYTNGNLLAKRFFRPQYANAGQEFEKSFTYYYNHCIHLSNGNFLFYGKVFSDFINTTVIKDHFAVIEFDPSFNLVNSYTISSALTSNYYGNLVYFNSEGKGLLSLFQYAPYPKINEYYASFNNLQFQNQRRAHYETVGISEGNAFSYLDDNGYAYVQSYYDMSAGKSYIEFKKMHSSDTSSQCLGIDTTFLTFLPLHIIEDPAYAYIDANELNRVVEVPMNFSQSDTLSTSSVNPCVQINSCDTIKIHGNPSLCGSAASIVFTAFKNSSCGAAAEWRIDPNAIDSLHVLSDSSVRIWFKNINWQGKLSATLPAGLCNLSPADSVAVSIIRSQSQPNLGIDTVLCTGNTMVLHAGNSYSTYQWQNGSTDSSFTVTTPGIYWVHVTDLCGNNFTDSITITQYNVSVNIGLDRTKCNSDTLHLNASPGFTNYAWSNNYNINSLTSQNVIVDPLIDTSYFLKAQKFPGCFAYDTVKIKVNTSPPIHLGADTSLCSRDSVVLDAGPGFSQYLWSNGKSSQQVSVFSTGSYSITGTTAQGCRSFDTLAIRNVWPTPVVNLDHDTSLCAGTKRTLNAGSFSSYLWQNGSASSTIVINSIGTYYVTVTDVNQCKGSDTVRLLRINSSPANFLSGDTSVCSYGEIVLVPNQNFTSYLWNTGQSLSSIKINSPGIYWLQVTDLNKCAGRDSLTVSLKQCMQGFYVPTAFSPNNDGVNEIFRPLIFGNLSSYELTIYNRFGEIIFHTKDQLKGWNGKIKGLHQDAGSFVWVCWYRLNGEPKQLKRGIVMLLR